MKHKNILLITTDQQSADMIGCSGNLDLKTPNIDFLAESGIRFDKSYSAQPLCIPQRCSWYTGLMPHQHGITFNITHKTICSPTMMGQIFRDAGYATGYSGKWHINVPVQDKQRHGFEWINNITCNGADQGIVPDFKTFLSEKNDKPFIFSASFNNPHNICEATRGGPFPDGIPKMFENINQLPALPDNFNIPEMEPSVIREIQNMYKEKNYPTANWDEIRWRLHRWYYCRMVELIDQKIGQLLDILKENNNWNDTLIVFTSDHGDGNAHHKWNQKQVLYDEAARIPFIIAQPNKSIGHIDDTQLVNTGLDLIPTLCGLAGINCPSYLEGKDWSEALENPQLPVKRDHIVIETEFGTFNKPIGYLGRAVRTQRYKYMIYDRGKNREFLVDMENDPGEMTNLANNKNFKKELDKHRFLLKNYITKTNDIFPIELVP